MPKLTTTDVLILEDVIVCILDSIGFLHDMMNKTKVKVGIAM